MKNSLTLSSIMVLSLTACDDKKVASSDPVLSTPVPLSIPGAGAAPGAGSTAGSECEPNAMLNSELETVRYFDPAKTHDDFYVTEDRAPQVIRSRGVYTVGNEVYQSPVVSEPQIDSFDLKNMQAWIKGIAGEIKLSGLTEESEQRTFSRELSFENIQRMLNNDNIEKICSVKGSRSTLVIDKIRDNVHETLELAVQFRLKDLEAEKERSAY